MKTVQQSTTPPSISFNDNTYFFCLHALHFLKFSINWVERQLSTAKYDEIKPCFLNASKETVKHSFEATTQYAKTMNIWNKSKAANPALNLPYQMEAIATDTVFADTPEIDNGATAAQFFCKCESMVCDVYPLKTGKVFVNTLETSLIKPKQRLANKFKIFYVLLSLTTGRVNITSTTWNLLNTNIKKSSVTSTGSWMQWMLRITNGSLSYNISATLSAIHPLITSMAYTTQFSYHYDSRYWHHLPDVLLDQDLLLQVQSGVNPNLLNCLFCFLAIQRKLVIIQWQNFARWYQEDCLSISSMLSRICSQSTLCEQWIQEWK